MYLLICLLTLFLICGVSPVSRSEPLIAPEAVIMPQPFLEDPLLASVRPNEDPYQTHNQ
jgi:hypothetical protein